MEVVMKIHHKFPKINLLWLLDGIGAYEGDAVANHLDDSWMDDRMAGATTTETQQVALATEEQPQPTAPSWTSQPQARFYQGELFAENAVFATESAGAQKNRNAPKCMLSN